MRAENVVNTGDVIAYGSDPLAMVEVMRGSGVHVDMGNCEESLGQRLNQCGCGFAAGQHLRLALHRMVRLC
jgi:hypothetical protein